MPGRPAIWRPVVRWTELRLLVAPSLAVVVGLLTVVLADRGDLGWTWRDLWVGLAFAGAVFATSLGFGLIGFRGDQVLFPIVAMLCGTGLILVQRLGPALADRNPIYAQLADRQAAYLGLGLGALLVTALIVQPDWLRRYKYSWLILSLGLLLATFVFGREVNGARLWLSLGPVDAQPSELIKLTLVTFLAGYLDDKRDLVGTSWRLGPVALPPVPYLLPMVAMGALSLAILIVQNDLGSALLFFGVFLTMLYVASGRPVYVVVGLLLFVAASWAAHAAFDRIDVRVRNWLDPWQDPLNRGYQQVQSDYALASGGLLGTGLGRGVPFRIPEVQTDYVFSAIGEELGLVGATFVLALCFLLAARGLVIGLRCEDGFARLAAVGFSMVLALQALIIVGGVVRLIPLTGLTLPFVSYGGSSLLTNLVIVGLLLRISALGRQ